MTDPVERPEAETTAEERAEASRTCAIARTNGAISACADMLDRSLRDLARAEARANEATAERDAAIVNLRHAREGAITAASLRPGSEVELRAERDAATARAEKAEAERDRQYEDNVNRIAAEGAALLRAENAEDERDAATTRVREADAQRTHYLRKWEEATARAERLAGALRDRDDKWAAIERFRRALAADIKKDPAAMIPKADVEDFLTAITTNMQSTIAEVHAAEARLSDAALTEPEAKGGDSRPCAGDHGEDR